MHERPYWIDDERIDRVEHRMVDHGCACGDAYPPDWDWNACAEQFDVHMGQVQDGLDLVEDAEALLRGGEQSP